MHLTSVLVTACAFFSIASAGNVYHTWVGSMIYGRGLPDFAPPVIAHFTSEDQLSFDFIDASIPHSVIETTFENPCTYKEGGIKIEATTGIINITAIIEDDPSSTHFFASLVGSECQDGMLFIVNPTFETKLWTFRERANATRQHNKLPNFDPSKALL